MRYFFEQYPRQYWLMFVGMIISSTGASMIWPFLMIYVTGRLNLPLTVATSLLTISSVMGLISSFIAGPILDRVGRKGVMVFSLIMNGLAYLFMSQATEYWHFAILLSMHGAFNPLYRVGADAMLADLIVPEKRADAYSIVRMSNNLGIALGPSIGGFIATISYNLAFYCAAAGLSIYGLLIGFFAVETLSRTAASANQVKERFGGYDQVVKDRPYMVFLSNFMLVTMSAVMMWSLLSVYTNTHYHIPENQFGFIASTNAIMVVVFQVLVTRITRRHSPLKVMGVGALFYAVGVGSIALAQGFWGFWVCMVVSTIGELILMPTSSTYAASLAPADKRGRYMSLYGLSWPVANGISPVIGGVLSDNIGPRTTWIGGGMMGLGGMIGFALMVLNARRQAKESPAATE